MRISDWSSDVCSSDLLNLLEHVVDDRWRQIRDRNFPDLGENVPFEAAKHIGGMDRRPLRLRHLVPLSGDTFERVSTGFKVRLDLELLHDQIGREPCRARVCQYV